MKTRACDLLFAGSVHARLLLIVRINLVDVTHRRHIGTVNDIRDLEVIGDLPTGFTAPTFDQGTKNAFSRTLIPPGSYEEIMVSPF